jgi:hypothetical protein
MIGHKHAFDIGEFGHHEIRFAVQGVDLPKSEVGNAVHW